MNYLAVNEYGYVIKLLTKYPRKELMDYFGVKHAERIYQNTSEGTKMHVGWIVAKQWWSIYQLCEWSVN